MSTNVLTLVSVPAILALVNLAKGLGLSGKWAALVAVVLGAGLAVAQGQLGAMPWFQDLIQGVLLGLSAAGLYDLAAPAGRERGAAYTGKHGGEIE